MKIVRTHLWCICPFFISFLCIFLSQFATAYPKTVKYLSIEQGLSNNSVRCIFQDHNGFMWFGTYDGLNRYDGYTFKVLRNQLNDATSLPHNYIYALGEDKQNRLWVGTGQGAVIYNSIKACFSPVYYTSASTGRRQKLTISTNAIQVDAESNVFIGTNGQGLLIQQGGDTTAMQVPVLVDGKERVEYNVPAIAIDANKQVWVCISEVGLCRYDYSTHKLQVVCSTIKDVTCIAANGKGIWMGSNNGLYLFNTVSNTITQTYTEASGGLSSGIIVSLLFDKQQNLWIGMEGSGIDILYTLDGTIEYLKPGQNEAALSSESAYAIYEDKQQRKWIGTLKGGINIIEPGQKLFQTYAHQPAAANSLIYNFVSCFYEDTARNLWVGTDGGGFSIWNRQQDHFSNYSHQPGKGGTLSNNLITSIKPDHAGKYWIATYGGGINKFNPVTGVFQQYHCINPLTGLENKNVWLLYEDRQHTLWATTFSGGKLYRYNSKKDKFEMYAPDLLDLISFTEDAGGVLWAGNAHELIKIDRQSGTNQFYEIGKPVRKIYEDKQKNLWLGTEGGGLILFNRQTGKIAARYADADGLCNNSVLNILEDDKGNLWLSTYNGLSRFHLADKSFRSFYQSDGLQSNQFIFNAALHLQSGELVFGGIKGFTLFNPDSLRIQTGMEPLLLTDLRVNNQPLAANAGYISKTDNDQVRSLQIPYNDAVVSFDFAALEYSQPDKISYAYYLEGWDKDWNYSGKLKTASYTHLKEGTYTLKLKATNTSGTWNPEQTVLTITVLPPWYRTWWAYLIYACIVAGLIYLYNGYRVRQANLEYEVKLAHIDVEKEKELNEKKLSFFTNISHEFRTPLTLIINPLKDFLSLGHRADPSELNIVYRNANRLLRLVDQLLQFQKAGSGSDQLKVAKTDFGELSKEVYESFETQAQRKQIDYRYEYTAPPLKLFIDREKIEIALFNLLSNALKYTPEGGRIVFGIQENETDIIVTVADTGPGIPEGVGEKLFERFYQVNESQSKPGFGIGLYLVKHFVELHKGSISYKIQPGGGTIFTLTLLKGKAHFDGQTIVYAEPDLPPATRQAEPIPEPVAIPNPQKEKAETEELVTAKHSILIVEDDADIRQYIKSIFQKTYNVYEAPDGEAGIRLAKEYLPDLIISDVMMPNATGIELCKAVKGDAALSHIPIILLTAASASDMKLKGLETGADDYITKPFEKELLVARVVNLLKKRSTLQNYFYNEVTLQQNNLKVSAEYKAFLERCIAIVEAHLDDEQFSIKTLSTEIGMSHSNLYKKVKSISGQSVNAFIRFIRLRKAAELFINTNMNVNETAFEVGINDLKYFREQFSKLFGINPSEYIKKYRKAFGSNYRVNKDAFGKETPESNTSLG